jgi:hypothetical protein
LVKNGKQKSEKFLSTGAKYGKNQTKTSVADPAILDQIRPLKKPDPNPDPTFEKIGTGSGSCFI